MEEKKEDCRTFHPNERGTLRVTSGKQKAPFANAPKRESPHQISCYLMHKNRVTTLMHWLAWSWNNLWQTTKINGSECLVLLKRFRELFCTVIVDFEICSQPVLCLFMVDMTEHQEHKPSRNNAFRPMFSVSMALISLTPSYRNWFPAFQNMTSSMQRNEKQCTIIPLMSRTVSVVLYSSARHSSFTPCLRMLFSAGKKSEQKSWCEF